MSDLRLFADMMHEAIAMERRLKEINRNAAVYADKCTRLSLESLNDLDKSQRQFHASREGLCAVRIILAG
ncbi:hypothetical protein [Agrobacterium vitis]|uniref:hypothetical protein n=1 Tax=Agrobacterium vitis TaxID=373 RepID=UPI0008DC0A45|nr:hypothetical protein [Agrobacterium vitis]MCF1498952.1 hypothetical protein [Allorhizobium sp. Av2]MUO84859.1 hypothetical protein [Agrobacterium vitis]